MLRLLWWTSLLFCPHSSSSLFTCVRLCVCVPMSLRVSARLRLFVCVCVCLCSVRQPLKHLLLVVMATDLAPSEGRCPLVTTISTHLLRLLLSHLKRPIVSERRWISDADDDGETAAVIAAAEDFYRKWPPIDFLPPPHSVTAIRQALWRLRRGIPRQQVMTSSAINRT